MLIYFHKTSILYINVQEYLLKFSFIEEYNLCLIMLYIYIVHSDDSGRWLALISNKN